MPNWEPASSVEVAALLRKELPSLDPVHRAKLEELMVPMRAVPVADHPGESVWVVAERDGFALYYSDVEEGWEWERLDNDGGISTRGCNQFELRHVAHQLFGAPGNS